MKPLRSSILLILILTTSLFAQSEPRPQSNAADVVVTDLQIEAKNVNQVLAEIAYRYSVPISLEAATNEDLLKSKRVTVQIKNGKIADVLESIVKQKPAYTWEAGETSIRVFPRSEFRDPLLQTCWH